MGQLDCALSEIKSGSKVISIHSKEITEADATEFANGLKELETNSKDIKLDTLRFTRVKFSNDGLKLICEQLSIFNLKKLSFDWCYIQQNGAQYIADFLKLNNSITDFVFSRNCATEDSWLELKRYNSITMNVCNNWVNIFADMLMSNNTITYADLFSGYISEAAAKLLAKALQSNNTLNELDISYSKITTDNMQIICEAMVNNTTLQKISAKYCGDPEPSVHDSGLNSLQFHQVAANTLNEQQCDIFLGFDSFKRFNKSEPKRMRPQLT